MKADIARKWHTMDFASAVACNEVQPFVMRLDLGPREKRQLPGLARAYLVRNGGLLPCIESSTGESSTEREVEADGLLLIEELAERMLPKHADDYQMFLWEQEVFPRIDDILTDESSNLQPASGRALVDLVRLYRESSESTGAALLRLESQWLSETGLEDRRPYSTLARILDWQDYLKVWKRIEQLEGKEGVHAFVRWARQRTGAFLVAPVARSGQGSP